MIDQFIGRFHPLLVHLPIGILMMAVLFEGLSRWAAFEKLKPALPLLYLLGALSAGFACLTGYLLSLSGEYATEALGQHQWLGIGVAVAALVAYLVKIQLSQRASLQLGLALLLFVGLNATGHLGGNLTHGADYLTQHAPVAVKRLLGEEVKAKVVITDVQQAQVYRDLIVPVLEAKCYSCHSASKQKGKLRLDDLGWMAEGGKSGLATLTANHPERSELVGRIELPEEDEAHMPPEGKPQVSADELALLRWWIEQGASDVALVADLSQPDPIAPVLARIASGEPGAAPTADIADPLAGRSVPPIPAAAVRSLRSRGVVVLPRGQGSDFLEVSFLNRDSVEAVDLADLRQLAQHLCRLKLSGATLPDSAYQLLAACPHLLTLHLDASNVQDRHLPLLAQLPRLHSLNLMATAISSQGLRQALPFPALTQLYLFQTEVTPAEADSLAAEFGVEVIAGGYQLAQGQKKD